MPPPPNDVSIRTMESDIKSMALSGGSFTRAEKIQVPQSQPKAEVPVPSPEYVQPSSDGGKSKGFIVLAIVVLILLLGALAYFLYPLFVKDNNVPPVTDDNATTTPSLPGVPDNVLSPSFTHTSFFRRAGDRVLDMNVKFTATNVTDLENYDQKIDRLLSGVTEEKALVELSARREAGQHLSLAEFFDYSSNRVFTHAFLDQNFNPDFTFFIYKNKNGFWPGFVIKLAKDKNWVVVKPEVAKLERSANLADFFITEPGERVGDFKDKLVSSQSARVLSYSKAPASLIYGWFHDYLVISTSEEGLKEAVGRL